MRNIGLMGYSRSGKDTAGAHLVQAHGYRRVSFADPVRESLLALDPIVSAYSDQFGDDHRDVRTETVRLSEVVESFGWERAKDGYPEVRELLQRHGTDAVRGVIGDGVWVKLALRKIAAAWREGRHVVVTDVRFPNEVAALRKYGFHLVWLSRPGFEPVNAHSSETSVHYTDADSIVVNNDTPERMYEQLDAVVR